MITTLINKNEAVRQKKLRGLGGFIPQDISHAGESAEGAAQPAAEPSSSTERSAAVAALDENAPKSKGQHWQMFSAVPSEEELVALIDMAIQRAWEQKYGPVECEGEV